MSSHNELNLCTRSSYIILVNHAKRSHCVIFLLCQLFLFLLPCSSIFRDLVVECLDDRDDSIRLRALDLIAGMVSKKNLVEITKKLVSHMDDSESTSYRDEVLSKIILICSQNSYQYITNFEW